MLQLAAEALSVLLVGLVCVAGAGCTCSSQHAPPIMIRCRLRFLVAGELPVYNREG
jgi:hypothetical protein